MDEKPYQLLGETREPLPLRSGDNRKTDSEYIRCGTCSIFIFTEPLADYRHVAVCEHRIRKEWAEQIRYLLTEVYPEKEQIILVMDNLNTHTKASLYQTFPPEEAYEMAKRLEIHYTPKHGSWLNIAEIELNAMTRQCLLLFCNSCFSRTVAACSDSRFSICFWILLELGILVTPRS